MHVCVHVCVCMCDGVPLTAHQDRLRERNADVQKIADGLSLGEGGERGERPWTGSIV